MVVPLNLLRIATNAATLNCMIDLDCGNGKINEETNRDHQRRLVGTTTFEVRRAGGYARLSHASPSTLMFLIP